MANLIKEFQKVLFTADPVRNGKVIKKKGNSVIISSNIGVKDFSVPSPDYYKVGNTVYFKDNVLLGTLQGQENLPRYSV